MKVIDFIKEYKPYAIVSQQKTGISYLFTLAQAALESDWGRRAPGNNFFGMKANATTPEQQRQLLQTREVCKTPDVRFPVVLSVKKRTDGKYDYLVKDWFMKYNTPQEGFTDHAQLFFRASRYTKALLVKDNPYKFAEEIAKAGYATAPTYAQTLKKIIKQIENYV